jgi:ribulose-5-phosphate 4-epimerase/fuculose-1-phosphate aldolase
MSVHSLPASRAADPVTQAKVQLAAAHRMAVIHELEEGIDNHFTVTVPGRTGQFLILPFGWHW